MPVALPVAEGQVSPLRAAPTQAVHTATRPFHIMTKPIGPICNLDCKYCFYLEKEALYQGERKWQMPDDVLEQYIKQYIHSQPGSQVSFAWQGGEPTLLGVRFFRKVIELQKKHGEGRTIDNAFQTNGTLLDDEWGEFLKTNGFLVGLSIDGPPDLHDSYRVDKQGNASSHNVLRGLEILKKHQVDFNTLTVVNRINSQHPLRVYRYLRDIGSGFIQFIPLVERNATEDAPFKDDGLWLQGPPDVDGGERYYAPVTDWSVRSRDYGVFLATIFDEWVRRDIGGTFVQMFDVALGNWLTKLTGRPQASLCVFSETCGSAMAVEHNGDVFSCDHYVYPRYKLGNIMETPLGDMVQSPFQKKFGLDKRDTLPKYCRECEVRHACHGECPKHRFIKTPDGEDGLNYLCGAYKPFFNHIDPYMKTMASMLTRQQPPAMIKDLVAEHDKKGGPLGKRFKVPKPAKKRRK
jgi:uncharacterized protein